MSCEFRLLDFGRSNSDSERKWRRLVNSAQGETSEADTQALRAEHLGVASADERSSVEEGWEPVSARFLSGRARKERERTKNTRREIHEGVQESE